MSNNRNNSRTVYGGVGVFDVLQLVFIVLKLCGAIDWSWWWVLSPTWLVMLAWVFLLVFAWIAHKMTENSGNKGKRWEI